MTLQEIREEATALCDADKTQLATELLAMVQPSDYWVSDQEVLNRVEELESNKVAEISFEELKRRLGK